MFKHYVPLLCLGFLAVPAWAQSEPAPEPSAAEPAPEKILVLGQRPGPGLWKISKGEHVLWVFGAYSPLPEKMEWRAHEVEAKLSQSQEFLSQPSTGIAAGYSAVTALPFMVGFKNNPDGARLQDVVPAEVYARWLPLKAKYIGDNDGIERERPMFASDELFRKGLAHAGLSGNTGIDKQLYAIAKKYKVKTTWTGVTTEVESPVKTIRAFKKSTLNDVVCFSRAIERLETDLDAMRVRANAWAKGDIAVIESLKFADRDEACADAVMTSVVADIQPEIRTMKVRAREKWLAAAEKSLAINKSTFAMLSMKEILDPNGLVAAMQARGYMVEKPE
ncbi:TraB/GumN family protein [Massilia sp. RP-1-19]|uniref:TraB/GumN family protein n=1 Tax=Massilia polaris TaxID=2728846 RepID=A0A848HK24_9BURK|nr:TraB/GumN family protein [Massilia polaris]NML61472.1 TraB/GumN family protein [Massilia polaris]